MEDDVFPARLKEGQPQLTMTSISSLDDLGPFFASICNNVTRQQAKSNKGRQKSPKKAQGERNDVINSMLERDFLEH